MSEIQALNDRLNKAAIAFQAQGQLVQTLEQRLATLEQMVEGLLNTGVASPQVEPSYGGFEIPPNHFFRRWIMGGKDNGLHIFATKTTNKNGKISLDMVTDPAPKSGFFQGPWKGIYCGKAFMKDGLDKCYPVTSSRGNTKHAALFIGIMLGGKPFEFPLSTNSSNWDDQGKVGYVSTGGTRKTDGSGNAWRAIVAAIANGRPSDLKETLKVSWSVTPGTGRAYMDLVVEVPSKNLIFFKNPISNKGIFNPERNEAAKNPFFFGSEMFKAIYNYAQVRMIREELPEENLTSVLEEEVYRTVANCFWSRESYLAFRQYAGSQGMGWPEIITKLTDLSYSSSFSYGDISNQPQVDRAIEGYGNE